MDSTKIASPQDLQAKLGDILAYCQGNENPSRAKIASALRSLAAATDPKKKGEDDDKEAEEDDAKKPFHVGLYASKALDEEGYKTLTWMVFPKGGDEETPTVNGSVEWDEEVAASSTKKGWQRIWYWEVQIDEPGRYVLKILRGEDKAFVKKEFRIRRVN